jgi:L-rhamnose mutarotase
MTGVRRFGMAARLVPDKREEYLRLHREVWPQVEAMNAAAGIRNFTIFVIDDVIFGYYEYIGDDFEADQARMAEDETMQLWWSFTAPCQLPFTADSTAANWQLLDEVSHQD